jgi:hypothetical protein
VGRNLLELVFRGREPLVADVYSALCRKIETDPRPPAWVCFVALVSLQGVPGGELLDPMEGATALCGENEIGRSLVKSGLTQCRAILDAARHIQRGLMTEVLADLAMMKEAMDGMKQMPEAALQDERSREILWMLKMLQEWSLSIVNCMR